MRQFKGKAAGFAVAERNAQKLPDLYLSRQFDRHFIGEEPVECEVYCDLYKHTLVNIKELRRRLGLD